MRPLALQVVGQHSETDLLLGQEALDFPQLHGIAAERDQRLADQPAQGLEKIGANGLATANGLDRFQEGSTRKDGEPIEQGPFPSVEQVVAPIQRSLECLMPHCRGARKRHPFSI